MYICNVNVSQNGQTVTSYPVVQDRGTGVTYHVLIRTVLQVMTCCKIAIPKLFHVTSCHVGLRFTRVGYAGAAPVPS